MNRFLVSSGGVLSCIPYCFLACFLCSCTVHQLGRKSRNVVSSEEDRPKHILLLDEKGQLRDPNGKDYPVLTSIERAAYISNLLASIRHEIVEKRSKKRLLVFVHGGMNSWNEVLGRYNGLQSEIMDSDAYPLLVIWPSSIPDTYAESLLHIRQGEEVSSTVGWLTSPFVFAADVGRAASRAPLVWGKMIRNDFEGTYLGEKWSDDTAKREAQRYYCKLVDRGASMSIDSDRRSHTEMYSRFGAYVLTFPGKLLTSPIIDAFGKTGWENMLRRTENIFPHQLATAQQTNISVAPSHRKSKALDRRAALPLFFYALSQERQSYPIDLVGHSMGTIILNRVVEGSPITFANIVYMAAACTVEDFHTYLDDYLASHPNTQFYCLTLHPVADSREMYKPLLDLPPRGSLLVWIDNFLSNPLNTSGKTLGRWENLYKRDYQNRHALDDILETSYGKNLHFKAFAVGTSCGENKDFFQWHCSPPAQGPCDDDAPQVHGDFTGKHFWDPAFWKPVEAIAPAR